MKNKITIALVGNPNSGKTTMFNELTGSYQYVGNWPGVTVEKKEGKLKGHRRDVRIMDLPGIYSLSPYTLEEVITRNYLMEERPEVIINIVDAANMERNLYLTTQVLEMGIPVVVALNMMDIVKKRGDKIDTAALGKRLGCTVVETSATKGYGMDVLVRQALATAESGQVQGLGKCFAQPVEDALAKIGAMIPAGVPQETLRYYTVKLFERDEKTELSIDSNDKQQIESIAAGVEKAMDDEAESIITNERYDVISGIVKDV